MHPGLSLPQRDVLRGPFPYAAYRPQPLDRSSRLIWFYAPAVVRYDSAAGQQRASQARAAGRPREARFADASCLGQREDVVSPPRDGPSARHTFATGVRPACLAPGHGDLAGPAHRGSPPDPSHAPWKPRPGRLKTNGAKVRIRRECGRDTSGSAAEQTPGAAWRYSAESTTSRAEVRFQALPGAVRTVTVPLTPSKGY